MLSIVQYIYIHTVYMYSFDTILEQRGKKTQLHTCRHRTLICLIFLKFTQTMNHQV